MTSDFWINDFGTGLEETAGVSWEPELGNGFERLQKRMVVSFGQGSSLPEDAFQSWKASVLRSASRCASPHEPGKRSQLVVGRVQAGKTSSFTGLIRLLADNGYRLTVVVAGTSTNLRDQTFDRLEKQLSDSDDIEIVRTGTNFDPKLEASRLIKRLRRWGKPDSGDGFLQLNDKKIVYVALKSTKAHLESIVTMFSLVSATLEGTRLLASTPTLIVDDEADQASPNGRASAKEKAEMTAVYGNLKKIRLLLAHHSYVGYTATPYANILMDSESDIRPERVTVLEPGADYTGAIDLFLTDRPFSHVISDFDSAESIPESLKQAFAVFICQTLIFHCLDEHLREEFFLEPFLSARPNQTVTMLVHADRLVHVSKTITELLRELRQFWYQLFSEASSDSSKKDVALIHVWNTYFESALVDLETECSKELDRELFRSAIGDVIGEIEILEIIGNGDDFPADHSGEGRPLWKSNLGWVLVGGQLLDRGQTLPNLMNTYMPRSPGGGAKTGEIGGQFDTLQQRGRFYGHRRTYRSILRGWFSEGTLETYREIAQTEQIHFDLLTDMDIQDLDLTTTSVLVEKGTSRRLKLVRKNVLSNSVIEVNSSFWLARQLWYSPASNVGNVKVLNRYLSTLEFSEYEGLGSISRKLRNFRANDSIANVLSLLGDWKFLQSDASGFEVVNHYLSELATLDNDQQISVVLMSRDNGGAKDFSSHEEYRSAGETLDRDTRPYSLYKIKQLPSSNDSRYTDQNLPTLQIHYFDLISNIDSKISILDAVGFALSAPSMKPALFRSAK